MKLATTTGWAAHLHGETGMFGPLSRAGFDGVDYSMFFHPNHGEFLDQPLQQMLLHYDSVRKAAEEAGMTVVQMHAPMPSWTEDPAERTYMKGLMEKAIAVCGTLKCPYLVIHPAIPKERQYHDHITETRTLNIEMYSEWIPLLKQYGVQIGVENMCVWDKMRNRPAPTVASTAEEMLYLIQSMNQIAGETLFVACLDLGHAGLSGEQPEEMIRVLGDNLKLLHVHDNDKIKDLHNLPWTGTVDWDAVCKALGETGYNGSLSLEADSFPMQFPASLGEKALEMMHEVGRTLIEKIVRASEENIS